MSEMITNVNGNQAMIVPGDGQTHYDFGVVDERERIIARLRDMGVLRDSMVAEGWLVIYTDDGPMDIRLSDLVGDGK